MKKALITVYGGGHVNIANLLMPLIFEKFQIHVVALTSAYDIIDTRYCVKYSITDIVNLYNNERRLHIKEIGRFFHVNQNFSHSIIDENHSIDYLGLGFYELMNRYSFHKAMSLYLEYGRHIFLQTEAASRFIDYIKPDLIIATTSPRFERAFLLMGNSKGIKTVQIDDLFGNNETQFIGQNLIVANEAVKSKLLKRGVPENDIFPLGNLVFEKFAKSTNKIVAERVDKKLIITFAPHKDLVYDDKGRIIFKGDDDVNHANEFKAFATLKEMGIDFDLVVRPHPNDDSNYYKTFNSIIPFSVQEPKEYDLKQSILETDIWVTPASTTGVQALLMGKKVVTYNFRSTDSNLISIYEEPPFYFSKSIEHLSLKLFEAVSSPKIQRDDIFYNAIIESSKKYKEFFENLL